MMTLSVSEDWEKTAMLSLNSLTRNGQTRYTLCVYCPSEKRNSYTEWLNRRETKWLEVNKNCKLTAVYVNNLQLEEAVSLGKKIKAYFKLQGLKLLEYAGRHKDEDSQTSSPQGNPWGLPSCGISGPCTPWHIQKEKLEEMMEVVRPIYRGEITLGERAENLLIEALRQIAPRWVKVIQAPAGSILDMKGNDVVIQTGIEIHYSFQIKSNNIDAVLHREKYDFSTVIWIDPGEKTQEIQKLALQIAELTWKKENQSGSGKYQHPKHPRRSA